MESKKASILHFYWLFHLCPRYSPLQYEICLLKLPSTRCTLEPTLGNGRYISSKASDNWQDLPIELKNLNTIWFSERDKQYLLLRQFGCWRYLHKLDHFFSPIFASLLGALLCHFFVFIFFCPFSSFFSLLLCVFAFYWLCALLYSSPFVRVKTTKLKTWHA